MSQRLLGIDLGSWSVKIVEMDVGLRATRKPRIHAARVTNDKPWPDAALDTLTAMHADLGLAGDASCVAIPGERVLIHPIEAPFKDAKKIAAIVPYELESQIPWEIDEVSHDFVLAGPARTGLGSLIIVAAARRAEVATLVTRMVAEGFDPRVVMPAPMAYAALADDLGRGSPAAGDTSVLWLDVGHQRTNVCVLRKSLVRFTRTISRGGHDVTDAIRRSLGVTYAEAEALKHEGDFDIRAGTVALAVAPLLRDLRITLEACQATVSDVPQRVVLTGGGARLVGLSQAIGEALDLPVEIAGAPGGPLLGPLGEGPPEIALALACALRAADKVRLPNLRTGELAYRGDVSFLRGKLPHLAACMIAVLGMAISSGFASLTVLKRERQHLEARLAAETRSVFGNEILDGAEVSRRLKGTGKTDGPLIPAKSALEVLNELSEKTPPGTELRIDVRELDVKPKRTYVKAATDSAAAVDTLVEAWKRSDCVAEIQKGRVADAAGGQEKQFTLTVDTKCF